MINIILNIYTITEIQNKVRPHLPATSIYCVLSMYINNPARARACDSYLK